MSPTSQPATKDRILDATADLFRRHGYTGTGLKQIVAEGQRAVRLRVPPLPGRQATARRRGDRPRGRDVLRARRRRHRRRARPRHRRARLLCRRGRRCCAATDYADACPIETVALEVASTNETLRIATADVFESWIDGLAARIRTEGIDDATARELSIMIITMLEGAFVLRARVAHSRSARSCRARVRRCGRGRARADATAHVPRARSPGVGRRSGAGAFRRGRRARAPDRGRDVRSRYASHLGSRSAARAVRVRSRVRRRRARCRTRCHGRAPRRSRDRAVPDQLRRLRTVPARTDRQLHDRGCGCGVRDGADSRGRSGAARSAMSSACRMPTRCSCRCPPVSIRRRSRACPTTCPTVGARSPSHCANVPAVRCSSSAARAMSRCTPLPSRLRSAANG